MLTRNWFSVVALSGILVLFVGCSTKLPDGMPKLYPAQIEVTATDGEKLEGATVILTLIGGAGEPVGGVSDANGIAKLYTRGDYAGAPLGKYKVCVNRPVILEGPASQQPAPTDPKELAKYNERVASQRRAKPTLESEYMDHRQTPLEVEVIDGKNNLSIQVKKLDKQPVWGSM